MWTRRVMVGYTAWIGVLTLGYFLRPEWHLVTWALIGLTCVAGIVTGVIIHRPSHIAPWLLLAAANLAFTAGDTTYNVLTSVLGERNPYPSPADALYLATYPLFAAGLIGFLRHRGNGRDRGGLLDALIVTSGMALLSWIYLIEPYTDASMPWLNKATSIAFPLGDVLMLAMLARLVLSATGARTRSIQLLTIGTLGILSSDVLYGLIQLNGNWQLGTQVDLGWVVFFWAWGLAALDPSMKMLTERAPRPTRQVSTGRLVVLGCASLIAPGMLLLESIRGEVEHASVIAVFSIVLFVLVMARLSGVVGTHRRAVARERILRESAALLVTAVSVEEISQNVRITARALFGAGQAHRVVLAVCDGDVLAEVPANADELGWRITKTSDDSDVFHRALQDTQTSVAKVRDLGEPLASSFDGLGSVLLCPLVLPQRPSGEPLVGMLAVATNDRTLAARRDTIETLASQVALAVDRVALSWEVNRRNSELYFRTLVHNASDVILILDDDDTVRYVSPSAETMFGGRWLGGELFTDVVAAHDRLRVMQWLERTRERNDLDSRDEWQVRRKDGVYLDVEARCSNLRKEPTVRGLVLTLRDVTEQRALERELKHRAFHDALTGLPNRVLFLDRVQQALARASRTGTVAGVLFIDLDDFKVVNDTMGHSIGDELLVAVARRLTRTLRAPDTPARLGGDEFAVLVEDAREPAAVETLASHVVRAFAEPFELSSGESTVFASIGVATSEHGDGAEELLRHADIALYAAKAAGRRQWSSFQPGLHEGMLERHTVQASLEEAFHDTPGTEFSLLYQPMIELATGRVCGLEALVRWPGSRQGLVLPDQFIGLAEETGHIVQLGAWALDRAVTDMMSWQHRFGTGSGLHVSVNVSARQFRDPGFVDSVRKVLDLSGLAPECLVLELTESVLMGRNDRIVAELDTLKDLGVRLAIDDFGTGYSSLSYLRDLPIDVVKIDKSFIDTMTTSPQELALVEGIVRLAQTLGLQVIAEGIESEEQRDLLVRMQCPLGQGYLFAPPLEYSDVEQLFAPLVPPDQSSFPVRP